MRKPFIAMGGVIISLFVFLVLTVMPAGAVPPLPHTVYGRVQLNGADVADGTIIRAYVNGVERASTTSLRYNNQSVYSLDVSDDPNWNPPANPPATGQTITFTFNGNVAAQTATWQSGATQALTLTATGMTQTYQVSANTDDAYDRASYCTTNLAKFGISSSEGHTAGFRFTSVTKPITATTAQSAYLRWTANSPASVLFSARIYAQETSGTAAFDCTGNKPSQRVKTGAFSNYTAPVWATGNTYDSPDLAPLLNEVLATAGGSWDKTFVLLVTYSSGGISTRDPEVFDSDPANATRLVITWGSPCATPGTTTLVAPAHGTVTNDTTPTFSWNAASNATRYQVQIDNNSNFSGPEKDFYATGTSYTLAVGLAPGTYYWRVRGQNTNGGCNTYGPWSSTRTLVITDCAIPGTPVLVGPAHGTVTNNTTPTFSWTAASNATDYNVQIDNNSDFSSPEKNFYTTGTSYTLAVGLAPGTYYWRVRGRNTTNPCNLHGPWSSTWTLVITDCATPGTPALVAPISGTVTTNANPTFSWTAATNATDYNVQIDNNSDFSSPEKNFYTAGTSYTLAVGLAPGTYYWRVRGRNASGSCNYPGPWSSTWRLTISSGLAPPVVTGAPTPTPTSEEIRRGPTATPTPTAPPPGGATPTVPVPTPVPEGTPATIADAYFIAAAPDDAYSRAGYCTVTTVKMGDAAGEDMVAGLRFANIQKREGKTLVAAHLEFVAAANGDGPLNLHIAGADEDNAPPFDCEANKPHLRPATAQTVAWSPASWLAGETYRSPNVVAVVRAVLARAGWANDNALALLVKDNGSATNFQARHFEAGAPFIKLVLTWQ